MHYLTILLRRMGTATVITLPLLAFGQSNSGLQESPYTPATHEKIHYGIRVGLNMTTGQVSGETRPSLQPFPALGWMVAGLASYRFNQRFGIKAELGYARKVSKLKDDSLGYKNTLNLHLADFSFIANYRYPITLGKLKSELYFGAGPSISYWLGSDGSLATSGGTSNYSVVMSEETATTMETMYLTGTHPWQLGLDVGAGIMLPITRVQRLLLELRANIGFTSLGEPGSMVTFQGQNFSDTGLLTQKLHSLTLSASYVFSYNLLESKLGRSTKEKTVRKRDPRKQKKDKSYLDTRIKK